MTSETLTPGVVAVTMTNADTEYALPIPAGTKHFSIKTRDGTAFRLAAASGLVAGGTGNVFSIASGGAYNSPEKMEWGGNLYVACASPAKVVECFYWTK